MSLAWQRKWWVARQMIWHLHFKKGVKSEFRSTSFHFDIKVDRIQGILTDGAHSHDQYASCGWLCWSCNNVHVRWGNGRCCSKHRDEGGESKEFPKERLDGLDQGQTDEQVCLNYRWVSSYPAEWRGLGGGRNRRRGQQYAPFSFIGCGMWMRWGGKWSSNTPSNVILRSWPQYLWIVLQVKRMEAGKWDLRSSGGGESASCLQSISFVS